MTRPVLFVLNVALVIGFGLLLRRKGLLGYAKGGRWYATWLATGVITLMDELTSVFYAPAEAHRFIGTQAIFFIAFTSLLMRLLSSRMVEIAQILERNDLRGGGVYSFSYLVLGPGGVVRRRGVDHGRLHPDRLHLDGQRGDQRHRVPAHRPGGRVSCSSSRSSGRVAGLNILGIRENARVTFGIFIAAAFVFVNLIALGLLHIDAAAARTIIVEQRPRRRRRPDRRTASRTPSQTDHHRRGELRARLLGHRVGAADRRPGRGMARHLARLLVPGPDRRHRHAAGLGAGAVVADRLHASTRATSSRTGRAWSATCRSASSSACSAASS